MIAGIIWCNTCYMMYRVSKKRFGNSWHFLAILGTLGTVGHSWALWALLGTRVAKPKKIIWKTRRGASCKNITDNLKSRDASASKNYLFLGQPIKESPSSSQFWKINSLKKRNPLLDMICVHMKTPRHQNLARFSQTIEKGESPAEQSAAGRELIVEPTLEEDPPPTWPVQLFREIVLTNFPDEVSNILVDCPTQLICTWIFICSMTKLKERSREIC